MLAPLSRLLLDLHPALLLLLLLDFLLLILLLTRTQRSCAAVAGRKTIACPPARVRSLAQEACGAEDLTGHGPRVC